MDKDEMLTVINETITEIEKSQRIELVRMIHDKIPKKDIIPKQNSIHIRVEHLSLDNVTKVYDTLQKFKQINIEAMNNSFRKFES